jgi:prepilin-type processing-associated H-X9-DG protein
MLGTLPDVAKTGMIGEVMASASLKRGATYFGAENKYNLRLQKTRHFDGSNFAFADGHVKWIKQEAVDATFKAQTDYGTGAPGSSEPGVPESEAANLQVVFSWRIRSFKP